VSGNRFEARDGHWASQLVGHDRVAYDNKVLKASDTGLVDVSENWVVVGDRNSATISLYQNSSLIRTLPAQTPMHQLSLASGYVLYGGYGPVRVITPAGVDQDATVAPWRTEGVGRIFFVDGAP